MSITDEQQKEIVTIGGIHAALFKLSIWVAPLVFTSVMGFQWWIVRTVMAHDTDIAVIKMQLAMMQSRSLSGPTKPNLQTWKGEEGE